MDHFEDLRAAEAELSEVVDAVARTVVDLHARLAAVDSRDEVVADVAARLRNLKDVLASHVAS
jgi:hypothetical protein